MSVHNSIKSRLAEAAAGHEDRTFDGNVSQRLKQRLASQPLPFPPSPLLARTLSLALMLSGAPVMAQTFTQFGGNSAGGSAGAIASGNSAFATNAGSIAFGALGTPGASTIASGPNALAIGNGAAAAGSNSLALGTTSSAFNNGAIANGFNAVAGVAGAATVNDIAIGNGAISTGSNGVALGTIANVNSSGGVAIGNNSISGALESVALGTGAWATGSQSVAIGRSAFTPAVNATSIGNGSSAAGFNATAMGYSATAGGIGGTALGDRANSAGTGTVSIGRNSTANQAGSIALGDFASSTGNGAIALGQNSLSSGAIVIGANSSGSGAGIVVGENASALGVVAGTALGANTLVSVNQGVALGSNSKTGPAVVPASGVAATIAGAYGTVQAGFNTTDRTLLGSVSIGDATNYRQIINVADAQTATGAVNLRQLQGGLQSLTSYTDAIAGNLQTQITTNATNITNVTNRVNVLEPAVTSLNKLAVKYTPDASGNPTNQIALTGAGNGAPVSITNVAAGVNTNDAVNVGQLQAVAANNKFAVQYVSLNGQTRSEVNLQSDQGGPVIIHNMAAGVLATDGVNAGQLQAASANSVQYDTAGGQRSNIITLAGGNAGAPVTIRNVAAGVNPNDAVNVMQMQQGNTTTYNNAVNYTDNKFNNLVNLVDQRIRNVDQRITNTAKDAQAGTAMALAASGLRYNDSAGKTTIAGASSIYRGQMGLAFGLGHTSQDGRWRVNAAMTAVPTARKPDMGAVFGAAYTLN